MSAQHTPAPEISLDFVVTWFKKCADSAERLGKKDSAQLWRDGLQHIEHLAEQRNDLLAALKAIQPYLQAGEALIADAAIAKVEAK